ncbi:MAG: hypothetical protein JNJ95_07045 [Dechloromonas sp.]|nr:hypothetical protein [Dechloromonas sp.]
MAFFSALLLFSANASAAGKATAVQAFGLDSLGKIQSARLGKPFLLTFWSQDCAHCPGELKTLGVLKKRYPQLDIVLVATDAADTAALAAETARAYGLSGAEQWIFADDSPERIRYAVDRKWYGELPRTLLYDRKHQVEGISGLVPAARLQRWVSETR